MTSPHITEQDIAAIFTIFDTAHTGILNSRQIVSALRALGFKSLTNQADYKSLIHGTAFEERCKDSISMSDFISVALSLRADAGSMEEIRDALALFDVYREGKIGIGALRVVGERITGQSFSDEKLVEIIKAADTDGDGKLNFDEFARAVTKGNSNASIVVQQALTTTQPTTFDVSIHSPKLASPKLERRQTQQGTPQATPERVYSHVPLLDDEPALGEGSEDITVSETIAGATVTFVNGLISRPQVRRALADIDYDDAAMPTVLFDRLFGDADHDHDGFLTRDELCNLFVHLGEIVDGY